MSNTEKPGSTNIDLHDSQQWAAAVETYYDRIFRTALSQTRRVALAEEIAQETFVRAFERRDQFDGQGLLGSWLYRIAVNLSRDVLRRENIRSHADLERAEQSASPAPHPPDLVHRKHLCQVLRRELNDLAEPMRRAFEHTVILGYTYREAAEIEGVSEGTIASRVARTRMMLARKCRDMQP